MSRGLGVSVDLRVPGILMSTAKATEPTEMPFEGRQTLAVYDCIETCSCSGAFLVLPPGDYN